MTRSHSDCFRNHSVDLKRRPPKSRPTAFPWRIASPPEGGPQGLRRPRFSFFRFTFQTARSEECSLPGDPESRRSATSSKAGCPSHRKSCGSSGARHRADVRQRAEGLLYTRRGRRLSTLERIRFCRKSRAARGLSTPLYGGFFAQHNAGQAVPPRAVVKPHSSAVLGASG